MTEEVMMIPRQEFERLQDYYKGKITQSALLNKAGRLAAEKHMILKNPKIPSTMAVKMLKPLAREQARLTKRIRSGTTPTVGVGVPDEDGDELKISGHYVDEDRVKQDIFLGYGYQQALARVNHVKSFL